MEWYIVYIVMSLLIIPCLILGSFSNARVNAVFDKSSKILSRKGITSCELAEQMLSHAGIDDVSIAEINGKLSDCYDSKHKVVKLSTSVIRSSSVAALGITAHEIGHAVQDHKKMWLFRFRQTFVPIVNLVSRAFVPLIVVGTLLSFAFYLPMVGNIICWISAVLYGLSFLFYLITLPLERDASKKALQLLEELNALDNDELYTAKAVLRTALYTYLSAFTISLVYFLKALSFAFMVAGERDR